MAAALIRCVGLLVLTGMLKACGGGGSSPPATQVPVIVPEPPVSIPMTPPAEPVPTPPAPGPVSAPLPALAQMPLAASALPLEQLRILVIGQSIASNCNEFAFPPVQHVLQIGRDGVLKPAADPFEWADCDGGSTWIPLGNMLIDRGYAKKVIFMPIGVSGSRVGDWQQGGTSFSKLTSVLNQAKEKRLGFELGLWHQGSSDAGLSGAEYTSRLASVLNHIDAKISVGRWVIAVHSRCWTYDANIEAAQIAFGNAPASRRYPGPNTNLLSNEFRSDGCHLKQRGQQEVATMWFESIKNALTAQ
jgi:hypothetical protein